jgi:hypothetical protein
MNDLRSQLEQITNQFVSSVLAAMKFASLSDLAVESARVSVSAAPARAKAVKVAAKPVAEPVAKPAKRGRRRRASAAEVQGQKELALKTARMLKPGFSKGDVMKKSASKADLGRALSLLVADGKLTKKGDRRLARYSVK